jgi:hypothetical protein
MRCDLLKTGDDGMLEGRNGEEALAVGEAGGLLKSPVRHVDAG